MGKGKISLFRRAFVRLRGFRVRLGSGRVFEIGVSIVGSMTRRKSDTLPLSARFSMSGFDNLMEPLLTTQ